MPSGISVQPSTTAPAPRAARVRTTAASGSYASATRLAFTSAIAGLTIRSISSWLGVRQSQPCASNRFWYRRMFSVAWVPITPIFPAGTPCRRRSAAAASTMCSTGIPARAAISSNQPCAVLQGMAIAPLPAAFSPSIPRSSHGSGSSPPASLPRVRSGTRGSDHSTAGICSWSRSAGVSSVRRNMNCALASGPMPPSTPRTLSFVMPPLTPIAFGGKMGGNAA